MTRIDYREERSQCPTSIAAGPAICSSSQGMTYRSRNRQFRCRPRRYSNSRPAEPGLVEDALDGIVALVARFFRWVFGIRRPTTPTAARSRSGTESRAQRFARVDATVKRWEAARVADAQPLPYQRATFLLSKGERALWHPLYFACKGRYRIFAKVRLADVVSCPADHRDERRWFRKIGRYHVDFVICAAKTTAPLLVVELDDRSHRSSPRRRERDEFKDAALRAAGMPVYRITAQQAYDPSEIADTIERLIGGKSQ
jgi:hypothetical protein